MVLNLSWMGALRGAEPESWEGACPPTPTPHPPENQPGGRPWCFIPFTFLIPFTSHPCILYLGLPGHHSFLFSECSVCLVQKPLL